MKFGIIGAGPAGLTMGMFLKSPSLILEKSDHPGGLASSFFDQGYTFDYGPHIMFSKHKKILDFMIRSLGKNVHRCKRNNKIFFKDRLIKYPFENDLHSLPLRDNYECLRDYLNNKYKIKYKKPKDLKQWFLFHFGESICRKYLFPYNEKVWNLPINQLSMLWSERIPNPPLDDVIKSSLGINTEGYLHQLYYHYPLKGGYQAISEAWAKKLKIKYSTNVEKVNKIKEGFLLETDQGNFEFNKLISTIPVHELVKILHPVVPRKIKKAIENLIVNPILEISIGIKGEDQNKFTAVYFPEPNFLVNRISFPKTFSPYNAPIGYYSIQAEITCKKNSEIWKKPDQDVLHHVIQGLLKRRFIRNEKHIVYTNVKRREYAYVVYDRDYEKNTQIVRKWFAQKNIYLVGRFSYFEYANVDQIVESSKSIINKYNL